MPTTIANRDVSGVTRAPRPSGLADVLDLILDKGLVIDAFVRVSIIGIEVLTIDARVVVASVDTYLRFAEAVNRLDLTQTKDAYTLRDLQHGASHDKAKGALEGAGEEMKEAGDHMKEKMPWSKKRREEKADKQ